MALPEGFVLETAQRQVNLPSGFVLEEAPKSTTLQPDVPLVASQMPKQMPVAEPQLSMADKVKALYEVPATIGSAVVSQPASMLYGLGRSALEGATQGQMPSPEARDAYYRQAREKTQFQPISPASVGALESIGGALEKVPPYIGNIGMIPSAMQAAQGVRPAMSQAIQNVKPAVSNMAQALRKEAPTMAGVGAAEVPEAAVRLQMAQQLRVPGKLTKGMAERNLGQQQFEAETAKLYPETIGKPLIVAKAEANDIILQNFDAYVDATGKETYGLRETGKVVDKALMNQVNKAKTDINAAYKAAKDAGEMQEPVPYASITQYIEKQTPTVRAKLAPILDAVDEQIKINDPQKTGAIPINALEDVYKFINKNYDPSDAVGMMHAGEMKKLINAATQDKGGELYQKARTLRTKFGSQFEDVGAVDKLLRTKKGTTDRAVAFEDVFKHSILDGSKDDVAAIGLTLKKGGAEGQQAWKELQGQTIEHIKDKVTSSIDVDSFGNPVVSPAKFKSAIKELDQDGKLDYIFGKKGAEELRNLYEYTLNVNAPLKGAVNYSNTSSALMKALDGIALLPVSRVIGVKQGLQKIKESGIKKQVEESVNYMPESMANALRKSK
jgi:hypothetical protein